MGAPSRSPRLREGRNPELSWALPSGLEGVTLFHPFSKLLPSSIPPSKPIWGLYRGSLFRCPQDSIKQGPECPSRRSGHWSPGRERTGVSGHVQGKVQLASWPLGTWGELWAHVHFVSLDRNDELLQGNELVVTLRVLLGTQVKVEVKVKFTQPNPGSETPLLRSCVSDLLPKKTQPQLSGWTPQDPLTGPGFPNIVPCLPAQPPLQPTAVPRAPRRRCLPSQGLCPHGSASLSPARSPGLFTH